MAATSTKIGKEIKYGFVDGLGKGREYPVKGDEYFHRRGGKFVYLDTNGSIEVCATPGLLSVFGWAETPKDTSGKNCWKAKASTDDGFPSKVFVIRGIENRYIMPVNATSFSTLAKSHIGKGCVPATTDEANATYLSMQKAYYKASVASTCLNIEDVDTDNSTVTVSIRPQKMQFI